MKITVTRECFLRPSDILGYRARIEGHKAEPVLSDLAKTEAEAWAWVAGYAACMGLTEAFKRSGMPATLEEHIHAKPV